MLHGLAFVERHAADRLPRRGRDVLHELGDGDGHAAGRRRRADAPRHAQRRAVRSSATAAIPELFQTGETAYGVAHHRRPASARSLHGAGRGVRAPRRPRRRLLYLAPVGDPALGPVAFPHRESAPEIPQAALCHHVQDSTHIATNVSHGRRGDPAACASKPARFTARSRTRTAPTSAAAISTPHRRG